MRRVAALLLILPLAAALCPEDAFQGTRPEDCYMYGPAQSWQDAEQFCVSNKGHLTSVPNAFVNSFLISYPKMFSSAQLYWLGAVISGDIDMWMWVDGSSFDYTKWAAGEPKQGPGCLSVNASTGQWKSDDCHASKPFICKVPQICKKVPKCDGGWTFNERLNKCYKAKVARGYPIVALGLKNTIISSSEKPSWNFMWDDGSFFDYSQLPWDSDKEHEWYNCAFFQKEQADEWLLMDCMKPTYMATAVCQKSPNEA